MSGPQAELIAKVLNMGVAFAAVVVFTILATRFRRQQLAFIFTAYCATTVSASTMPKPIQSQRIVVGRVSQWLSPVGR